jgi:hypothetical protein
MNSGKIQGNFLNINQRKKKKKESWKMYGTIEGFCLIVSITSISKPYTKKNDDDDDGVIFVLAASSEVQSPY